MKKENDELINLFHSRLKNTEMPVRDNFMEILEHDLHIAINRRRQIIHRVGAAASVLLILGCASAAFWYFSPKEEIADAFTRVAVTTGTSGTMGVDVVKEEFPAIQISPILPKPSFINSSTVASSTETIEEEESITISILRISSSFSFSSRDDTEDVGDRDHNSYTGGLETNREFTPERDPVVTTSVKKKKRSTWSAGLFASGDLVAGKQGGDGLLMLSSRDNSLNVNNGGIRGEVTTADFPSQTDYENYRKIFQATITHEQRTSVKHKMPLSLGFTVRKEITGRFALETGLVYTQLNSELKAGRSSYYTQDQKLHYLGIPLKADVDLYGYKHFTLYASAGGMIEKCIAGNIKTNYYQENKNTHSSKKSVTPDPVQLSVSAAIGLQYNISNRLALYAAPGIAYHFDDGSPVATIRKEKPLNMNLLCGIKMSY